MYCALSLDETKPNQTKQLNLRQADSVVYQVHRPMSPIPKKPFSLSGMLRLARRASLAQGFREKRNRRSVTVGWRIVLKLGLALVFVGPAACLLCQNANGEEPSSGQKLDLRGKSLFEEKCSTCHGLDGLGGEHAPDIIRRPEVKTFSDAAWLGLIHDGIPEEGMPGFPDLGGADAHALVAYLRSLQGRSAGNFVAGNPARGHRRVQSELVNLGHPIAASTVWQIPHAAGIDPAPRRTCPTWKNSCRAGPPGSLQPISSMWTPCCCGAFTP